MRRRPQSQDKSSISLAKTLLSREGKLGIVLSGGGARAAYQVGALRALIPYLGGSTHPISIIVGSSIGAINGLVLGAALKNGLSSTVSELEDLWRERNFRNTFSGSPSRAFFRAIRMAVLQYLSPGPNPSGKAVFNPEPLMQRVDSVLQAYGGLSPEARDPNLLAVAVMTTIEGPERKPLLFLSSHKELDQDLLHGASFDVCHVEDLSAKHGFASAALPSVLPPVELDTQHGRVRLVDGGISQNVPVDPAVRLGANQVILIDISGRDWWLDRYGESHDTRPKWEVPAGLKTFCLRPPETFVVRCQKPLGALLKEAVGKSTSKFISAVGPVWPVFSLLRNKMGEDIAYEAMTYVALDPDYVNGLLERGYNETTSLLKNHKELEFQKSESYETWAQAF